MFLHADIEQVKIKLKYGQVVYSFANIEIYWDKGYSIGNL